MLDQRGMNRIIHAPADGNGGPVYHRDVRARNLFHILQRHHIGAVDFEKRIIQLLGEFGEGDTGAVRTANSVHVHVHVCRLDVADIGKGHLDILIGRGNQHRPLAVSKVVHRLIQHGIQLDAVHRLDQIMKGRHIKTVAEIFVKSRDEDDLHRSVFPPHALGNLDAVYLGHFDIEKQDRKTFYLHRFVFPPQAP